MSDNLALLQNFYRAFQARDGKAMAACYHPEVVFSDPVFPALSGESAGQMWQMLCARGKDLRIEFSALSADENAGSAHWEAWYTFSASGRPVHNIVEARFAFKDGKIIHHTDEFDFPRWARQALGFKGLLLGRSRFLLEKVRATAAKSLADHVAKNSPKA